MVYRTKKIIISNNKIKIKKMSKKLNKQPHAFRQAKKIAIKKYNNNSPIFKAAVVAIMSS